MSPPSPAPQDHDDTNNTRLGLELRLATERKKLRPLPLCIEHILNKHIHPLAPRERVHRSVSRLEDDEAARAVLMEFGEPSAAPVITV